MIMIFSKDDLVQSTSDLRGLEWSLKYSKLEI